MSVPAIVEKAFSPIARAVEQFAEKRSMCVDKCPRSNAGWELVGTHALGGEVSLLLLYDDRLGLGIGSVWQFPCPEMSTLYSHFRPMRPSALVPDVVVAALETEWQALSDLPFGYWTHLRPLQPTSEGPA